MGGDDCIAAVSDKKLEDDIAGAHIQQDAESDEECNGRHHCHQLGSNCRPLPYVSVCVTLSGSAILFEKQVHFCKRNLKVNASPTSVDQRWISGPIKRIHLTCLGLRMGSFLVYV